MNQSDLKKLVAYDPLTGIMRWLPRPIESFALPRIGKAWNTKWAGRVVGSIHCNGYLETQINGETFLLHQLAWLYEKGEQVPEIDHEDGNRTNNRISNLRSVTRSGNSQNMARRSDNTSGVTGVYWHKRWGRWAAHIRVGGKVLYLGGFDDLEEAKQARKAADAFYGFHPNHGRGAREALELGAQIHAVVRKAIDGAVNKVHSTHIDNATE